MTLYYFHIDGEGDDETGVEYENLTKAKRAAVQTAGQAICDAASNFWEKKEWGMTVTDKDDLTLFTLSFSASEAAAIAESQPV